MSGERADVLVVGAGASGAVVSKHLAEAGFKVTCLEQGGWVDPSGYPGESLEWELLSTRRWHVNPNVRRLDADYPCETSESDINPLMHCAVGGSTIHYAAQWMRFLPSDFRVRSLDGLADDWPFGYEELAPYYDAVQGEMGVSGLPGDPAYPPHDLPMPALPIGRVGRVAAEGMNRLGWHWWPGTHAMPSRDWGRQKACARRGTCMTGCIEGAKGSMDVTHWPDALAHGARLVTGARVREITTNEAGLATGAVWIDRAGVERHEPADVVVLACNGVGTPRLLLLSTSARFPDGLANSTGLVGRRLMMHPFATVMGVYDDDLESWLGPVGNPLYSLEFYETDGSRGFPRGAKWELLPLGSPLGLLSRYDGLPFPERYGTGLHALIRRGLGRAFEWGVTADDLPEEGNRVTLDPELADSDGVPAPRIRYRVSEATTRMLEWHVERVKEAHEASGAVETVVTHWMPDTGWHLLGTACMGDDPTSSVVDRWCRSHDVRNLYVVDGSVFPTGSGTNPTATICAVALRCARRLVEQASLQEVPVP
jgi:choline dehydrogenase-like flavoprotein